MPLPFTKLTTIPLGPVSIQAWGLLVALGMLFGLVVALKEAKRRHLNREAILDAFLWMVLSSLVGGRLFYVVLFWQDFWADPVRIFKLWEGGMVFYGGIFGAILALWIVLRRKKIPFWTVADAMVPGFALGIFVGRLGCYLIGDHIGKIMVHEWPWGSIIPGENILRHEPSLYLSLNGLILFMVLWSIRKRFKSPGQLSMLFFIWYGLSRFLLDFFRADDLPGALSDPRFWGLTISQLLSFLLFIFAVIGFHRPQIFKKPLLSLLIGVLFLGPWTSDPVAAAFSDVPETHEHYAAVQWMESRQVIEGYEDGTFRPEQTIARAEALKIILLASAIAVSTSQANSDSETSLFTDIQTTDWFYPYVSKAVELKLIQGYADGSFKPEQSINLAETLKIISLAMRIDVTTPSKSPYPDMSSDAWFAPYVEYAKKDHFILAHHDESLHPDYTMTRGELIELMYRFAYVKEFELYDFDLSTNWLRHQNTVFDYSIKVPFGWEVISGDSGALIVWYRDTPNGQQNWTRPYLNSASVVITVDTNEAGLSAADYFARIENNMAMMYTENDDLDNGDFLGITTKYTDEGYLSMFFEYYGDDAFYRDAYTQLPNGDFIWMQGTFGPGTFVDYSSLWATVMAKQLYDHIYAIQKTILHSPATGTASGDPAEAVEQARQMIQVDGEGQNTLNLFSDLELIETDSIGVGTGPVDYYYSTWANITLKYERSFDVILDLQEGRTSAF